MRTLYILLFCLFIFSEKSQAQVRESLQDLVDQFYSYHKDYPQQKIYIHTDKPYYLAGEEMYGRVYLVNEGRAGFDSTRSKKIYVELINEEDSVVERTIVNGLYSSLNFSFPLRNSLRTGNYLLRAYNEWMTGFKNSDNIFRTYIYVFNKTNHIVSGLAYIDSSLATVRIHLQDALKKSQLRIPVHYEVMDDQKMIERADITTNSNGDFLVNINSIPKERRDHIVIKIRTGSYETFLRLPSSNDDVTRTGSLLSFLSKEKGRIGL